MQITVKSTTKESKQAQGKTYWGVKHDDGNWYNVITDNKPSMGAKLDVEIKTSEWNGRTYRWATPIKAKEAPEQQAQANGSWEHYAEMARAAHRLAKELEPDEINFETPETASKMDRSTARAAILNTVMIAYSNGKVALPAEPEPPEFGPAPQDDDIPF